MHTVQCAVYSTVYNVKRTHCIYMISLLFRFSNCAEQKTCADVVNNGNIRMPFKHYVLNILSSDYCSVLKLYADTIFITIDI